jgi:xylulokinase
MATLLGLDIGTTAVKAGLFTDDGRMLAVAGEEYRLDTPAVDRAELDPERYWAATRIAVRRAVAAAGVDRASVGAIAVSSQGETVIPVAADGRPIGPALVWLDNRATAEARQIEQRFGADRIYDVTGVPTVIPTWTACKLLWWRANEPDLFAGAARFLLVEDFLLHRLTGRFVTDGGVQSTTLLFDIAGRRWWDEMLDVVGIDAGRLAEPVEPGDVVGTLAPASAEALGLLPGVIVVAAGMDQGAGAVGVGNTGPGIVSESTGGALTLQASVDRHGRDPSRQAPVYIHSAPGRYLYCPVCPTGGMALTWFRDTFGQDEVERAARDGRVAYDLLTELAANVPAGSDGLVMLPHLAGAFSPEYDPSARGVFYGFGLGHGKGHFIRATLEAVAFMLRRNVELLADAGAPATEIHSHGGGARSPLWNQIKADVCRVPVVTLRGEDAAVRGDAMLAGVATGAFRDLDEGARAMVAVERRYEPDPTAGRSYELSYEIYRDLFQALRPVFAASAGGAAQSAPDRTRTT